MKVGQILLINVSIILGLVWKWTEEMIFNQTLHNWHEYQQIQVVPFRTLTIEDLQLAFLILSGGILCSIVVFFMELCRKLLRLYQ